MVNTWLMLHGKGALLYLACSSVSGGKKPYFHFSEYYVLEITDSLIVLTGVIKVEVHVNNRLLSIINAWRNRAMGKFNCRHLRKRR